MSDDGPEWLPELVSLSGSVPEIFERLYDVFKRDFKYGRPMFRGLPVWWDRRCLDGDPREEGFWHIITKDDEAAGGRILDAPRARRLAWARAVIDNAHTDDVAAFEYEESRGRVRTYLWVKSGDYVVILEKKSRSQRDIYFLTTAFSLDGPSRRRAMEKKFQNRLD